MKIKKHFLRRLGQGHYQQVLRCLLFCNIWVWWVKGTRASLGEWEDMFVTLLLIIITSEVSTFPIVIFSQLFHIDPEKAGINFIFIVLKFMMCENNWVHYGINTVFVFLTLYSCQVSHSRKIVTTATKPRPMFVINFSSFGHPYTWLKLYHYNI